MRLTGVLVANAVAALMVLGLAFDLKVISNQTSAVYLVTNGATSQQLAKIDTQQPIFVMREAVKSIAENDIVDIATQFDIPSQILSYQPTVDNIHVLGDGLNSGQWQALQLLMGEAFNNISVTFSASTPRIGLVDMQWPRELASGQYIEVKGQLQGTTEPEMADNIYQLNLLDPAGQIIETLRLKASEHFTLSFPAKSIGQWVYRLQLSTPNDIKLIADEPIAFSVAKPTPLRILIKQSAPSFETRQLKNWAAEFGSQISVLTQISQNKDIRQNVNLSAASLQQSSAPFTEQALVNFDWLLIDGRALLALTVQQMAALQTAIKNGLGVYIIADNELINAWPVPALDWLSDITIRPLEVANYSAVPYWPHSKIEQAIPLLKATIISTNASALVQTNSGQILVSQSKIGLGQVAISLINSTYGWQTSGKTEQYSHYWQSVIIALSRPKQTPYWLATQHDSLALVNQPAQKCLVGSTDLGLTTLNQNPRSLLLTQDLVQTEKHCLIFWPTKAGWQELEWNHITKQSNSDNPVNLGITNWFYTYSQQDWNEWEQAEKHKISLSIEQQKVKNHANKQSMQTLNKHWLWCLLVLTLSLLWLERKLF
jgi:hypothetical protein